MYNFITVLGANDCRSADMCLPKISPIEGCQNLCPQNCGSKEIHCYSTDPETGCYQNSTCISSYDDAGCPGACSPSCSETQKICTTFDINGCPEEHCIGEQDDCISNYDENGCFNHIALCMETQRECPGGKNEVGCESAPICISLGDVCPTVCDLSKEKMCGKGRFKDVEYGTCCLEKAFLTSTSNDPNCEVHCPAACDWATEKACSTGYDAVTGCPLREECRPVDMSCTLDVPCLVPGKIMLFAL